MVGEVERRFAVWGQPGSLKLTAFDSRARLGTYADAVREGLLLGTVPDVRDVQSYRNRAGVSFDLQQQISDDLGFFARAGWADGQVQSYEFADIDRSFSGGLVLDGNRWEREDDAIGLALAVNGISSSFVSYLDHGGLGLAIGDGRLPHPGTENIVETFYRWSATDEAHVTFDYQFVDNPAYNRDRGPVSVFAIRVHVAL
jgi:high affinity Mn2+ porin